MSYKTARAILRLALTAFSILVALAVLTTPAKSAEPAVITDELAQPVGPAQCWEAPDIPEMEVTP